MIHGTELTVRPRGATIELKETTRLPNLRKDPKARLIVELEPTAVSALLDDSYQTLKAWTAWELPEHARGPLRLSIESVPETVGAWLRVYRIEMLCEQAQLLRQRSDELGDILEQMPERPQRDTGAALKRAARAFYYAILACPSVKANG